MIVSRFIFSTQSRFKMDPTVGADKAVYKFIKDNVEKLNKRLTKIKKRS